MPRALQGDPASPGAAIGRAWLPGPAPEAGASVPPAERGRERERAHEALAEAAGALGRLAGNLPPEEAAIVEAGVLMAQDPALMSLVDEAITVQGASAAQAILQATDQIADVIAGVGDELLAARADDVRSLGRRAARLTVGGGPAGASALRPGSDAILVARDVGPADVAELAPALAGVALVGGGATAHAAIVARSLGIPMVTGLPSEVLDVPDGTRLLLDGASGGVIVEPSVASSREAEANMRARRLAAERARAERDEPAVTSDGRRIRVLANVAGPAELDAGLDAGAEGIGLLRTELAFLDATRWPSEAEHRAAIEPILAGLGDRPAVVRVLDFGADKAPPFLRGTPERGLRLLLANPPGFVEQLRAILVCARGRDVRILLPMVDHPEEIVAAGALVRLAADALGIGELPPIGAMIETPLAAQNATLIAEHSAFLSIGTNDLTAATLGADRFAANSARAHHPRVLDAIARTVTAAHQAGIALEVCGEAASDPAMLPLLVGLGVDEVSVGAARVGEVRRWIRGLDGEQVSGLARSVLELSTADQVEAAVRAYSRSAAMAAARV